MKTFLLIGVLILLKSNVCLAQAGALDSSFGNNGKMTISYYGVTGRSVAIQKDGKIVVCGDANTGGFLLMRLNSNGSVDSGFGVNGVVETYFDSAIVNAVGVAVQKDGKIIVAGSIQKWNGYYNVFGFALARYKKDGSLDRSFGYKGKVVTVPGYDDYILAASVSLQADGKILVLGSNTSEYWSSIVIHRYNTNGTTDAGFHASGNYFSIYDLLNSIALQSDQKIIGTGYTSRAARFYFLLTRLNTDGSLDPSFANNGKNSKGSQTGIAVATLNDDKIIVLTDNSSLKQFSKDGIADTLFGNKGKVSVPFKAKAIAVQSNNKIIVVGTKDNNFAVARYKSSGKSDKAFGTNGIAIADFGGDDKAHCTAIQHDGKIVTAGASDNKLAAARFNGNAKTAFIISDNVINNAGNASKEFLSIQVFPNPMESVLNIQFNNNNITNKTINIYNVTGKLLLTKSAQGNTQLDVKQLSAGTYLIKINDETGKELFSGKVIKQ
ncbi:MAG TPA: T9SS type A sorting domain-containing protein [Parafilimonas sp.]|nr:T9SS type A sorting domain-containing protein [Parafilimonas sp.]